MNNMSSAGARLGRISRVGAARLGRILAWVVPIAAFGGVIVLWRKRPASAVDDAQSGRGDPSTPASQAATASGHELEDMSGALMMWLSFGLGGTIAVVIALMLLLHGWLQRDDRADQPPLTAMQTMPVLPPSPHLQVNPMQQLAALRAHEDGLLRHYAWIDKDHRRARIPIARAMILMVGHRLQDAP